MTKKINWEEVFESYQLLGKLFAEDDLGSHADEIVKMMCSVTGADDGVLLRNTGLLNVYGDLPETVLSPEDVLSSLPILYGNFPCTRFEKAELESLLEVLPFEPKACISEGLYFSFELGEEDSLWFLMFKYETSAPWDEHSFEAALKASSYIEQLVPAVASGFGGDTLSRTLDEQKQRENIWLESLDWLNDVGRRELLSSGLPSFYKTSLYQLKLLARAKFAQAYRFNREQKNLTFIPEYSDEQGQVEITRRLERLVELDSVVPEDRCLDFQLEAEDEKRYDVKNLIIFPIFLQKKLNMILCVGRDGVFRDSERKIARLFAEGVNHFVERSYFLRALKHNVRLLRDEKHEQQKLIAQLEQAKDQLLQQEKLASIGQLAAGVAHEINNPVGYVSSNISMLDRYFEGLYQVLALYENAESSLPDDIKQQLKAKKDELYFEDFKSDIKDIITESKEGVERVKQIVSDMKDFSHVSQAEWHKANLAQGIDSTLNIVHNEVKFKAEIVKEYQDIPEVECMPSRINQVVMNLVVNAAQAIKERGVITIRLFSKDKDWICIEVEDNGEGIKEENLSKLFDPFFTTKPVGQGTGLGLSLSYSIVESHGGEMNVTSTLGVGTTFTITLPVSRQVGKQAGTIPKEVKTIDDGDQGFDYVI